MVNTHEESLNETLKRFAPGLIGGFIVVALIVGGLFGLRRFLDSTDTSTTSKPAKNLIRESNYSTGKLDSKITVLYLFDFLCSACQQNAPIMKEIRTEYQDRVKFTYKSFIVHKGMGDLAAQAAQAAGRQGKYIQFEEILMTKAADTSSAFGNQSITDAAKEADLDIEKWNKDRGSKEIEDELKADQADIRNKIMPSNGVKPGETQITGTPSTVILKDGEIVTWWTGVRPKDDVKKSIDDVLKS